MTIIVWSKGLKPPLFLSIYLILNI